MFKSTTYRVVVRNAGKETILYVDRLEDLQVIQVETTELYSKVKVIPVKGDDSASVTSKKKAA